MQRNQAASLARGVSTALSTLTAVRPRRGSGRIDESRRARRQQTVASVTCRRRRHIVEAVRSATDLRRRRVD